MKDVTNSVRLKRTKPSKRWAYLVLIIIIMGYYYLYLPPLHYASPAFWRFMGLVMGGSLWIEIFSDVNDVVTASKNEKIILLKQMMRRISFRGKALVIALVILLGVGAGSWLICSPVFLAKSYSQMIQPQLADFETDFPETDPNQIPLIDRDTASRLGNRRIGVLTDLVSQFEAAEDYTQINIKNHPYRVSPLNYAGFWKWLSNQKEGVPNYIQVDMVSGDVEIKQPKQAIRYSAAEYFNRNVHRHLRFNYPFTLFGSPSFEVDDEGNPYYIASTYTRHFFLREPEVDGLITVNAMTGETTHYKLDEIPTWVDRVYSADLIMHQLKMNGTYKNGFWNTLFTKKGVTIPTEGYTYLPMKDDVYLYTGMTSVASDNSNIGFVLVNMRTKETKMYHVSAAEEFSAMRSAEGSVQETGYKATFPLLINLQGKPLYILSLKDDSGLIKKYALIDVENYQQVFVDTNVAHLVQKYVQNASILQTPIGENEPLTTVAGNIQDIQSVVINGNTIYYLLMEGKVYRAEVTVHERLPFLKVHDAVEIQATGTGDIQQLKINQ